MNRSFAWQAIVWCFLTAGVLSSTQAALDDEVLSYENEVFGEQDNTPGSGLQMTEFENETATVNVNASVVNVTIAVNVTDIGLPSCSDDELLTFDGTAFNCSKIPERKCICPSPMVGSGEPPTLPPEPPGGCTVFEPPGGGGFVCLSAPTMIYCSVYCDNTHDFSTVPHNPYKCGKETKFEWKDLTGVIYEMLPECTIFRHSARPVHRAEFYLSGPCEQATSDQADVQTLRNAFCTLLTLFRITCDPNTSNVFVRCPVTGATTLPDWVNPNVNP